MSVAQAARKGGFLCLLPLPVGAVIFAGECYPPLQAHGVKMQRTNRRRARWSHPTENAGKFFESRSAAARA